nr:hypothetical protein HmN_000946000 [Hymenolepis microstoma]
MPQNSLKSQRNDWILQQTALPSSSGHSRQDQIRRIVTTAGQRRSTTVAPTSKSTHYAATDHRITIGGPCHKEQTVVGHQTHMKSQHSWSISPNNPASTLLAPYEIPWKLGQTHACSKETSRYYRNTRGVKVGKVRLRLVTLWMLQMVPTPLVSDALVYYLVKSYGEEEMTDPRL